MHVTFSPWSERHLMSSRHQHNLQQLVTPCSCFGLQWACCCLQPCISLLSNERNHTDTTRLLLCRPCFPGLLLGTAVSVVTASRGRFFCVKVAVCFGLKVLPLCCAALDCLQALAWGCGVASCLILTSSLWHVVAAHMKLLALLTAPGM